MARQTIFVHNKACVHGFIVADTFRIIAAHNVVQLFRKFHRTLFNDSIVSDDAQSHIRRDNRQLVQFDLREESIRNLHNTLSLHRTTLQIIPNEYCVVV